MNTLAKLLLLAFFAGCAGRVPLPEHLKVQGPEELWARMQSAAPKVRAFSAEARLTYFGKDGRLRGKATLVVARPSSLRYDVEGPHGGVLSAFAMNGAELALLDVGASRFLYGPASAQNLDELLPFAPLGLGPSAWVDLFFGEVPVPPGATVTYDEIKGRFVLRWEQGALVQQVDVVPQTSRLDRIVVLRGKEEQSEVRIDQRDERGLPNKIRIRVQKANVDVDIAISDVDYDPEIDSSMFELSPPSGVKIERL